MDAEGHTLTDVKQLPVNLLDGVRAFDADGALKATLGAEFSTAYVKLKTREWNAYTAHFSTWERENTLDI